MPPRVDGRDLGRPADTGIAEVATHDNWRARGALGAQEQQGWDSVGLTDDPTPADAERGRADGSPVVHLDGPLEAHNEWARASHRQTAHPRTAAMKHET
jgi:hypothetical protein